MSFYAFPDEIVLAVLGRLSKKYLKRTRLLCKRLALLSAPLLLDVIYISPQSKNVEVFEAITQHPVFNAAVKDIVYDSAKFADYSLVNYYNALYSQLYKAQYQCIRLSDDAVRDLMALIPPRKRNNPACMSRGFQRCLGHAEFLDGYYQHTLLAQEQKSDIKDRWFIIVCDGLRKLGPVQSVTIRNTWDMIYDDVILDDFGENSSDSDEEMDDLDCRSDTEAELFSHEMVSRVAIDEWHSIGQAFNLLVQLLTSTEKRPRVFRIPGNVGGAESFSPTLLESDKSTPAFSFLNSSVNLKTLHLKLASVERGATVELVPDLSLLKTFFKTSMSLTTLTLVLLIEWIQDHEDSVKDHSLYNFTQVFPPLPQL
ncbi:MAG: hypothetical protein Q9188_004055 [Gyalolechia gomerana]